MRAAVAFVLEIAIASVAGAAAPRWSGFSPGTLDVATATDGGPGGSACELRFHPDAAHGGDYWCGARATLNAPPDANRVEFFLQASDARLVHVKLVGTDGSAGYYELTPAVDDWVRVSLQRDFPQHTEGQRGAVPKDVATVEVVLNNAEFRAGDRYAVRVSGLRTVALAPRPMTALNWTPARVPPPVPGYRVETCIHNIWKSGQAEFGGLGSDAGLHLADDVADHLCREFGPVGITIAYLSGPGGRSFADHLAGDGGLPLAEGHNQSGVDWLAAHHAFAVDRDGHHIPDLPGADASHSEDLTDPQVLAAGQQRLLASARAGARAWRTVDYTWQWPGGPVWGYSDAARRRWRDDLAETDAGLELGDGLDPARAVHRVARFWEYFASYHGYRMTPADAGLADWSAYDPPARGAMASPHGINGRTAFLAMIRYEWLKYTNEVARPSVPLGMLSQPICNPENAETGTDLYWLVRLANVRGFATEWWNDASIILGTYYNGRYYDRTAATHGKEIVFLGESAAAGGDPFAGRPNYWDNQANFLITYAQAGAVDAKAKHDQYWGSSWPRMTDPARPEHAAYTAFRSAWCGFLQARNDRLTKPRADVLAITDRGRAFDYGSGQPFNLAADLVRLNYLHDGAAFPLDDAFRLDDYNVIVDSAIDPPAGFAAQLAAWVARGGTLVTSGFVPARASGPATTLADATAMEDPGAAAALGLPGLAETDQRAGVLHALDPQMAAELPDQPATLSHGLYRVDGGTPLVSLDGAPLVSERPLGRGRVIYLHFRPDERGVRGSAVQRAIVNAVLRHVGQRPISLAPDGVRVLAYDRGDHARSFLIFNANARTDVRSGDRTYKVFQAQDPDAAMTARLWVGRPRAAATVTDLITGQAERIEADADGYLPVDCHGWNLRGVRVDLPADR